MIQIIGDDIFFDHWRIGTVLDIAPASVRSRFVDFIESAENTDDIEEAAYSRGYEAGRDDYGDC